MAKTDIIVKNKRDVSQKDIFNQIRAIPNVVTCTPVLDEYLDNRKKAAELYTENLKEIQQIILPMEHIGRVWQDYILRADNRDALAEFLTAADIKVRGHDLIPNHFYDLYGGKVSLPKTEEYAEQFLRLPFSAEITGAEIIYVTEKIKEFYEKNPV